MQRRFLQVVENEICFVCKSLKSAKKAAKKIANESGFLAIA
jgi:hypothetical protein